MIEVNGMSCAEFGDMAAELALGVLTGRERADALEHLDHCDACREHVRQLTATGERLLGVLPASEPPPGFESRVMERLGLAQPRLRSVRPRQEREEGRAGTTRTFGKVNTGTRRILAAAAAVVVVAIAALGGWGLRGIISPSPRSELSTVALVSSGGGHENAGQVFLYSGEPRWMYMRVHLDSGDGTVTCQLVSADGRVATVGTFRLAGGYGSWGGPASNSDGPPVKARLLAANGAVLATANLQQTVAS